MKRAIIAEKNVPISVVGERVVVGGGTQGIGAGIACRFAQGGAEVWIIGRNETKGTHLPRLSACSTFHIHASFSAGGSCEIKGDLTGEEDCACP